ncbi:hypothetical protein B5X24_HaOG215452 [Helicoverpa armigera]|uniref:Ig-like domain-containing protein n=1 Tax=Helicoverpa armigera TaxID=29058 RepID=A0A2W1BG28_HELAM|nr:hypothetical protein B5X24_HaOG215452 [Helicoverpa armigera]
MTSAGLLVFCSVLTRTLCVIAPQIPDFKTGDKKIINGPFWHECQISTHPPLVRRVHLSVVVPKVEIVDERGRPLQDKFYKEGSIIELRCVVSEVPQPTRQVNWKHGTRLLNYDTKRGGVSVKTEATSNGALSRLYIANANRNDSGNYTCSLADVAASAVSVHVLRGMIVVTLLLFSSLKL